MFMAGFKNTKQMNQSMDSNNTPIEEKSRALA
jgi:hypothetical protein